MSSRRTAGLAFLTVLATLAGVAWAGAKTAENLSEPRPAQLLLHSIVEPALARELTEQAASTPGLLLERNADLVAYSESAEEVAAAPREVVERAADQRVLELYIDGLPSDPGRSRTPAMVPRSVINLLSGPRHKTLGTASTAAAILAGALAFILFIAGRGGARFALVGVAAGGAWIIVSAQRAFIAWYFAGVPNGTPWRRHLSRAADEPLASLFFLAVAFLAAGGVFGSVFAFFERRALKKVAPEVEPAPEPTPTLAPAPPRDVTAEDLPPNPQESPAPAVKEPEPEPPSKPAARKVSPKKVTPKKAAKTATAAKPDKKTTKKANPRKGTKGTVAKTDDSGVET
ncbi:MAG: hypothetical protein ACR2H3_05940 [Acidimicrobiales bacterium]